MTSSLPLKRSGVLLGLLLTATGMAAAWEESSEQPAQRKKAVKLKVGKVQAVTEEIRGEDGNTFVIEK